MPRSSKLECHPAVSSGGVGAKPDLFTLPLLGAPPPLFVLVWEVVPPGSGLGMGMDIQILLGHCLWVGMEQQLLSEVAGRYGALFAHVFREVHSAGLAERDDTKAELSGMACVDQQLKAQARPKRQRKQFLGDY